MAIRYQPDQIELAVRDDGEQDAAAPTPADHGDGFLGMRERVALYGGSLVTRVRPEGGFELVVTLPVESA